MVMELLRCIGRMTLAGCIIALSGCGGGSGSGGSESTITESPVTVAAPPSGTYAWTLKAQGATSAPAFGIALVNPAHTDVEYEIEPTTAGVSDVRVVYSGTVDASTANITGIKPESLVYLATGDVRRVPLTVNGSAPLAQVKRASTDTACNFVVDANDYASPDKSRYIVSTKGVDGRCGTSDDGQGEVILDAAGGVTFLPRTISAQTGKAIGMLRDPATLAPNAWIYGSNVHFWGASSPVTQTLRLNGAPLLTRVVSGTYRSVVAEYNNKLTVLDETGGSAVTETQLDATLTAGTGWKSIGFDENNYYVYRSSGTNIGSTWSVLKISRSSPVATRLASGSGLVVDANMGSGLLYLSVMGTDYNRLLTIDKTTPGAPQTLESTEVTTLSMVLTSGKGVHQVWRINQFANVNPSYTIEMIDELGNKLYTSASGGFPMTLVDAVTQNLNLSENRTRFVFVTGFGTRRFSDAQLIMYDTVAKAPITLGTLPGTADFGTNQVFASLTGTSSDFIAGFAARVASSSVQSTGAKVFSINLTTANSLKPTSLKQ